MGAEKKVKKTGRLRQGEKTKELVKRIRPGEVALIRHRDLDALAACSLVQKKVQAVLNQERSISGRYPNRGPRILLEGGILLLDEVRMEKSLQDGDPVAIQNGSIFFQERRVGRGQLMTLPLLFEKEREGGMNLEEELHRFVQNTLHHAQREKSLVLNTQVPKTQVKISGRQALVVVRGESYLEDLQAISSYVREMRPIIIGVDGGADGCIQLGFRPHIIIGDMDSVSDGALLSGAEIIVHAYPDGRAPGRKRVEDLGLCATTFPAPGTSEDIALLLAYEQGAELISMVGGHSSLMDFLEKGRPGMGSTFLVRMKIGSILVDAKGLSRLYRCPSFSFDLALLFAAALIPIIILLLVSPPLNHFFRLLILNFRMLLGL